MNPYVRARIYLLLGWSGLAMGTVAAFLHSWNILLASYFVSATSMGMNYLGMRGQLK